MAVVRKIYIYSEEEEEQINKELGYTQEDYDHYVGEFHDKYHEQQQFTIDLSAMKKQFYYFFHPKCPNCNVKLEKIKELRYVGFRNKAGATDGSYHKTYEVTYHRTCPICHKRFD